MTDILPTDAGERKKYPILDGLLLYFPRACAAVASHSYLSNEQHNPGQSMRWAKEKSIGEGNECVRHVMQGMATKSAHGTPEWKEEVTHLRANAWRALELLERKLAGMPPFDAQAHENPSRPE